MGAATLPQSHSSPLQDQCQRLLVPRDKHDNWAFGPEAPVRVGVGHRLAERRRSLVRPQPELLVRAHARPPPVDLRVPNEAG